MRLLRLVVVLVACGNSFVAEARPNILLILADDLNDWVGALTAHPNARTPNLDRLASEGMLFRQAYAASPKCNPSRTALLLGMAPSRTGIYDNGHWWRPHLPDATALPEAFRRAGYHVAGGGKIFHHTAGFNPPDLWDEYFPLQFDDPWDRKGTAYPGMLQSRPPPGHPLAELTPFRHELDWGSLPIRDADYGDARTVAWAERYLRQDREQPFLLAVGLFHPHLPWYAPQPFFASIEPSQTALPYAPDDDLDDVPSEGRRLADRGAEVFAAIRSAGKWAEAVRAYAANIAFADALVGRLLDALNSSPHAANTVVVFASDHGFHLGEKQHWYKSTLWERSTHVPLVIRGPGVAPGSVCESPVSLLDIYPTLLDLAGVASDATLDGRSLTSLLKDPDAEPDRHVVITYLRGNHAVRRDRWLYIRYRDGGEELYDRDADPHELTNLAEREEMLGLKQMLAGLLPRESAPEAPLKSAYVFNPVAYSWEPAP